MDLIIVVDRGFSKLSEWQRVKVSSGFALFANVSVLDCRSEEVNPGTNDRYAQKQ